jgi:hypothetical protein
MTFMSEVQIEENIPIYLRMVPLSDLNAPLWKRYNDLSLRVSGNSGRDILINFLRRGSPSYNDPKIDIRELTGFSEQEYENFKEKIESLKHPNTEISYSVSFIKGENLEMAAIDLEDKAGKYIIYATSNPNFCILEASIKTQKDITIKNFFESYKDLLTFGVCDFSDDKQLLLGGEIDHTKFGSELIGAPSFLIQGGGRNPYWILEKKYENLFMVLNEFSACVETQYFHHKTYLMTQPMGLRQSIIQEGLNAEMGFIFNRKGEHVDITAIKVDKGEDFEEVFPMNFILVSKLNERFRSHFRKNPSIR